MQYGLVVNDKIVVGPRSWNREFFLDYLVKNNLQVDQLPRLDDRQSVITDEWRLLQVSSLEYPELHEPFEQLVGPAWTIHWDHITGLYTKTDNPMHLIKGKLKETVANNRYEFEVGEVTYTFGDGQTVSLFMEREERMIYLNTLVAITPLPPETTIPFKFKGGAIRADVSKSDLQNIVNIGMQHIVQAFGWEASKVSEIEAASTIEELKLIETRHPSQIDDND